MKRIQCLIKTEDNKEYYVPAYLAAPGLAVHRETYDHARGIVVSNSRYWEITHIYSGIGVTSDHLHQTTRREAARLARCLAEKIDWTADEETLNAKIRFRTHIAPIIKRFKAGHDPE